jgi:FixJ family two-component response regulator
MAERSSSGRRRGVASDANTEAPALPLKTKPLISIIDDDESCREAIASLMNWLGFDVQTFASAAEFLASPDVAGNSCVITDVQMPHMTGIELHKRLTELGYAIPTILITAYLDEGARDHVLADGVVCYLSKPFDNNALLECVRSALQPHTG